MNQNVLTFTAPTGQPIRTALIHGEPWFVAADVCRALGLNADHTTKIGGRVQGRRGPHRAARANSV